MIIIPEDRMQQVMRRFALIEAEMAAGPAPDDYVRLAGEYSSLEPIAKGVRRYRDCMDNLAEIESLLADPAADRDMRDLAQDELEGAREAAELAARELQLLLLPKDEADNRNAILEIRAGTGGSEAALFAGDLFRMYDRYAADHGWSMEVLSASEGEVGGYKEIIARVAGASVFAKLKFESGVHRVQRVPETEAGGRIHTSAATVAVLPEAQDVDIEIKPEDIRIDTMRASGAGGQHVNTTDSAVRITHLPTGIMVTSSEKSQHQNRARAMQILKTRLYDLERQRNADARSEARRLQVGSGDRSERIRTYNFPQGRLTDHRINLTLYKLDRVMMGELDEVVDALTTDHQSRLLAEAG